MIPVVTFILMVNESMVALEIHFPYQLSELIAQFILKAI